MGLVGASDEGVFPECYIIVPLLHLFNSSCSCLCFSRQGDTGSQTIQACRTGGPAQEAHPPSWERPTRKPPSQKARQASCSLAKPQVSQHCVCIFYDWYPRFKLQTQNCFFLLSISGYFLSLIYESNNERINVFKLVSLLFTLSNICRHNGEVPSTRPKSDFEPLLPTKPKTLSGDWGEKSSDIGTYVYGLQLMSNYNIPNDGAIIYLIC